MRIAGQTVMLDRPDAIETQLVREQRLLDHIVEDLLLALARDVHHLGFIDNRELHLPLFPLNTAVIAENLGTALKVIKFLGLVYLSGTEMKQKMIALYGQAEASSVHTCAKNGLRRASVS